MMGKSLVIICQLCSKVPGTQMTKHVFFLSVAFLFFPSLLPGATTLACDPAYTSPQAVTLNEICTGGSECQGSDFMELYFNQAVDDVSQWELRLKCGNDNAWTPIPLPSYNPARSTYADGSQPAAGLTSFPKGTFLVYESGQLP